MEKDIKIFNRIVDERKEVREIINTMHDLYRKVDSNRFEIELSKHWLEDELLHG